jgi:hypothetical protein
VGTRNTVKEAEMTRFLLLALIMAIPCTVAFGQDYRFRPGPFAPAAPQQADDGAGVRGCDAERTPANMPLIVPSYARLEHLLKAAAHLEAAGLRDDAVKVWQQASRQSELVSQELQSLRDEVARLRPAAADPRRVLFHVKVVEAPAGKLRRLGIFPDGNLVMSGRTSAWGVNLVRRDNALVGALDALRKAKLLRVLAEPSLTTVNGCRIVFRTASKNVAPAVGDGRASADLAMYDMELDFLPRIFANGRLRIDLSAKLSTTDLRQGVATRSPTVPGSRSSEIETGVEMNAGQTLVLSTVLPHRAGKEPAAHRTPAAPEDDKRADSAGASQGETELCLLVTPEILEGVDVPPMPRK